MLSQKSGEESSERVQWSYHDYWVFAIALAHIITLIVLTVFISIMFSHLKENSKVMENNIQLISYGWVTTPVSCKLWINGNCARSNDVQADVSLLEYESEVESPSSGLFSSINAPFLCLAALVISTSYSLSLLKIRDENITPKMLKSFSLLILVVYGVFFLFIQRQWLLPLNNLIWVQGLFLLSFVVINTFSVVQKHMYIGFRLVNSIFTGPLIAVAVLSMVGEDDTLSLMGIYFTLVFSFSIILILNNEEAHQSTSYLGGNAIFIQNGLWAFWVCMIPFLVQCCSKFYYMTLESPVKYPLWSTTSIAFLFCFYIFEGLVWSVQYGTDWLNLGSNVFSLASVGLKTLDFICKFILIFLVIVGYYSEFK